MYKEHPSFIPPSDLNIKIWRYMDFTKFVALLDSKSLWFTRADRFEDPFEGSYPKMNITSRANVPRVSNKDKPIMTRLIKDSSEVRRNWIRYAAINCWHISEHESAAMWSLYLKSNEGIAIQSTYQRLKDSFAQTEADVYIGRVNYINYDHEVIENADVLSPFLHKRASYEHEKELRAITVRLPGAGPKGLDFSQQTIDKGVLLPINLPLLIQTVYVAPNAPNWLTNLIRSMLIRYDFEFSLVSSPLLNAKPEY
ncbi:hypothetical protein ACFLY3_00650 [Chloroflexota bacterium]